MDDQVRRDLERSEKAFREIVWPEISPYVGGGELRSLETSGSNEFDRTGGIDGYQVLRTMMRTFAQRTQFVDDYRKPATFTIRCLRRRGTATELRKRYDALNRGFLVPGLVIQAYVHEGQQQLIRVGITHGRPFYDYVFTNVQRWRQQAAGDGSAEFLVVPWGQISIDNAAGRSEVPFLGKDSLGIVHRTPNTWFSDHPSVFDDPRYFSHQHRNRDGLWI